MTKKYKSSAKTLIMR